MLDTMTRFLSGITNPLWQRAIRHVCMPLCDRYSSQSLTIAGLVINAGGATFPKIGATDFYATAQGKLVKVSAGTAMPALTGVVVTAGMTGVACFFVDNAGNLTLAAGTPSATLAGIVWPQFPAGKALIGFLIIPGAFTGGTTALDAVATVYISPQGPFDPTVLV